MGDRVFTAPPGFTANVKLESKKDSEIIEIDACNHFEKMLLYFYKLIKTKKGLKSEYSQNINQSLLIQQLKIKAFEK